MPILDKVNSPSDLKSLNMEQLPVLAEEMHKLIIRKVNAIGGHMGPNLGIVEATIALHYVFNSPVDNIVFDVSHQCYPHKILTGRKDGFTNEDLYRKYTGFTAPEESIHDLFKVGHTSTSVSLAVGLAKARDLKGGKENVIALIGDGSLSGGEAFEGFDNAAELNSNIIIIVNDNDMSIAENHGGLYKNLKELRDSQGKASHNFFKALGLDYLYVSNGNDVESLIKTFNDVKDIDHPIVVHICTNKGLGLDLAEENKEFFHWIMPGSVDNFNKLGNSAYVGYDTVARDLLLERKQKDPLLMAISPATPGAYAMNAEVRAKLGVNYMDVGIAEEHAIACASAMAKAGAHPVLSILSSFIQRTYDQLSQDLCLNDSPATIIVYFTGISGADATHLGIFDIPILSNIPNLVYLAPTCVEEFKQMLSWSIDHKEHPVAIRVPSVYVSTGIADQTDYSKLNRYKLMQKGSKVAILGLGAFYGLAQNTATTIENKLGFKPTVVNPIYITGTDDELLDSLKKEHDIVITLEDGELNGGFGHMIANFYGNSTMRVCTYGAKKEFTDRVPLAELYNRYHLTPDLICEDIAKLIK